MNEKKIHWCSNCLNMSTRPRITFDEKGWCNACQWMEEKKQMDWAPRQKELEELLAKYKSKNGNFDCIVPVSGGKDGSYVAYQLKHKYGMNPLAITVRPALSLQIGDQNLYNFIHNKFMGTFFFGLFVFKLTQISFSFKIFNGANTQVHNII